jgi:hypothetical protein
MLPDYPKLYCPFVRKTYEVDKADWKKHGSKLQLRSPEVYLVTPEVAPGFEWVLEGEKTYACEKLDGTNVCIHTENGRLVGLQNRENILDPLQVMKGPTHIIEGVFNAIAKGFVEANGVQYGEVIGPKLQSNPLGSPQHIWYPFAKAHAHLRYKSFHEHPRDFFGWSEWFRIGLLSRLATKLKSQPTFAEGVIFSEDTDKPRLAKLRRDMYPWHYWDKIKIIGLEDHWKGPP